MLKCASCSREIPQDSSLCPYCGSSVESAGAGPTITKPPKAGAAPAVRETPGSSSDSIDQARFTPGTMLTERYRIVGLLGKGGMGEVYRADDLKLRQPVALKFLPEALSKDTRRLERFHHEVRVARQVSHPNVCRVYDIGEADGQQFISMEYVDGGEDLASVLRRMGRPSKDKAIQIARQLCAGLAAAHDKGVLHRDLKPHNVMIDGRGKVRIIDFGLAGFAADFAEAGKEIAAGTPAYMAPEQLTGKEVTARSDIYSLGLVLYHMFTGQPAFQANTREQLRRLHSDTTIATPASLADELDPTVERVILRCLERDPLQRPSSALAVSAALPGGDPLAAALEAGETPDPAVVAGAGEVGGLSPTIAVPCLIGVLVGLVAVALLNDSTALFRQVPLPKAPVALADRASEIVKRLGHTGAAIDSAYGFGVDEDYLRYIEENDDSHSRWEQLATNRPPAMYFWYRQSPRPLDPPYSEPRVTWDLPPQIVSGMAGVALDPMGRLIGLNVVPPQREDPRVPGAPQSSDWSLVFEAAGLDMNSFSPTAPLWNPTVACDERVAWTGSYSDQPGVEVRVEAGAHRARPNFLRLIGPWSKPTRMETASIRVPKRARDVITLVVVIGAMVGGMFFAWRNLKLKRGDRRGAFRLSVAILATGILTWALSNTHVSDPWDEFFRFWVGTGSFLFLAGMLWLLYIAVEPYVRRRWPQVLISWMRLMDGRLRDPLVGRDMLIGALVGVLLLLALQATHLSLGVFGSPPPPQQEIAPETLVKARYLVSHLVHPSFVWVACMLLFVLLALRVVLRTSWLAILVFLLIFTVSQSLKIPAGYHGAAVWCYVLITAVRQVIALITLMRFGLLAFVVAQYFVHLSNVPLTLDFSAWYSTGSLAAMVVALAVAGYGFWVSLAGRPLLKDELLET